ncbi:MAG TPA: hypothetical protein PLQ36_03050 [Candidatus Gracilibacteria bacterium]|nr:hypothetical protein [Candidatus Gracilibacteria bacterium]
MSDPCVDLNRYFLKHQIPLTISDLQIFNHSEELNQFLIDNLKPQQDLILRYHTKIYHPESGNGHFSLISNYDVQNKIVQIGDPELPFTKTLTLEQMILAMSNEFDKIQRGIYVVNAVI